VLFGFAGVLISAHPPPYGPTGLILFTGAVVYVTRSRLPADGPVPGPIGT
jgi:hypothetical protein